MTTTDLKVLRPTSLAEARDAMRDGAREGVLIRGAGTKIDWGPPATGAGAVVETGGLNRLVAHNAGDSTAIVQAGMPLVALQRALAGAGQWLAIDPPHDAATVGGVFAANDAGPRRLRYGSMRDLVIGATYVTAEGEIGRSGGQVIKNVAGYDVAKLLCGSLGTLALVTELVVRLHPIPPASATVLVTADPRRATALTTRLFASPLVASALEWVDGQLAVRIDGRSEAVAQQLAQVQRLVAGDDMEVVESEAQGSLAQRVATAHAGADGDTVVRGATVPSDLGYAAAAAAKAAERAEVEADFASSAGLGLHTVTVRSADVAALTSFITDWRSALHGVGGHAVVRRRHPDLTDPELIWGPPPSAAGVMRALKEQLDPDGRCAPGRSVANL